METHGGKPVLPVDERVLGILVDRFDIVHEVGVDESVLEDQPCVPRSGPLRLQQNRDKVRGVALAARSWS